MKNLKMLYIALIAMVTGVFGACTVGFEPGAPATGHQVSFAPTNPTSVDFTGDIAENTQKLTLTRPNAGAALEVFVISEIEKGAESFFTIPETVSFAAGETTTELVYTVDQSKLENDKSYKVSFYIDETMTTPYGYAEWTISYALNPWELIEDANGNAVKGKLRGVAMMDGFWGVSSSEEINVNVYKHKQLKQYKVENPWLTLYMLAFGATEEELSGQFSFVPADLIIDYTDPNNVKIPQQSIGITENTYGYGEGMVIGQGGTLADGVITFPVEGIGYIHSNLAASYGWIPCNSDGSFRLVLPGVEIADYLLAVAYDGMDVAADNKTAAAKLKFTYGDDVTGIKYLVVTDNIEENPTEALATLFAGEDENILEVENFVQGGKEAGIKVGLQTGFYSIVAAPVDKNGNLNQKNATVLAFYFPGLGDSAHPCEVGVITEKFSVVYPTMAAQYPDYSAFAFCIYGNEIKDIKFCIAPTASLNTLLEGGAAIEDIITANNVNLYTDNSYSVDLAAVNGENGWVSNTVNKKANTSYTVAVLATNVYGETAVATAVHVTDPEPSYTGDLVLGNYLMSCTTDIKVSDTQTESVTSENVFSLSSNGGSTTDFLITDLCMEDGLQFHAKYDATAGTLTVDGLAKGYESYGSLFARVLYGTAGQYSYTLFVRATEESQGGDPIVFGIDPTTKTIASLNVLDVEVGAFDSGKNYLGFIRLFVGADTTIAPYVPTPETSSVKSVNTVRVPFRSGINYKSVEKVNTNKVETVKAASKGVIRSAKSVKPIVVESYTREVVKFQRAKANLR